MADQPGVSVPGARILVVEDEPITRKAVARALTLMGYQTDEAASGAQALVKLTTGSYDLMLLDLRMPGVDGMEVMKRVRASHPDLLIIVLTAYATVESAIAAVKAGAVDYLLKPSSNREIADAIGRALGVNRERLRRQRLLGVIEGALHELRSEGDWDGAVTHSRPERFLQAGTLTLDREKGLVVVKEGGAREGPGAELTANEAALLTYLMQQPGLVCSCRELARGALGYDLSESEARRIIRPHISRLRKKIEADPTSPRVIRTVRGKGYLLSSK